MDPNQISALRDSLHELAMAHKNLASKLGPPETWPEIRFCKNDTTGDFVCVCGIPHLQTTGYTFALHDETHTFGPCCIPFYCRLYTQAAWFRNLVAILGDHKKWKFKYSIVLPEDLRDTDDHCICQHDIVENCFIQQNLTKEVYVVGNCCVRLFSSVGKQTITKCGTCLGKHKNPGVESVCKRLMKNRAKRLKRSMDTFNSLANDTFEISFN